MNIRTQLINNQINTKEQFWHEHIKLQRSSMLSMAAYCRNNKLNYNQFAYWEQKLKRASLSLDLLPIKLIGSKQDEISEQNTTAILCTLAFKDGNVLTVHDKSILPTLFSMLC